MRAIPEAGPAVDLDVRLAVLGDPDDRRQHLLASGAVPPGRYVGLDVTVSRATFAANDGPRALAVAAGPVTAEVAFDVGERDAVPLVVRIAPTALDGGAGFSPSYSAGPPGEIADEAIAVGTVPSEGILVAFHKVTGAIVDVLRTCDGPVGLAYDGAERRAYVACERDDAIEVFDLVHGTREQSFPMSFGDRPRGLALGRDGRTLAVINVGSSTVAFLDAPRIAERGRIEVAREPVSVVPDPERGTLAVFSREGNAITLVDPAVGRAIATVATEESGPVHGAFDPRNRRLYVVHGDSPYLSVVDLADLRVASRAYVGPGGTSVAVDPRSGRVYVARDGERAVEIFDPASLLPIDRLAVDAPAGHLAVDPRGDRLYVAIGGPGEILSFRLPGGGDRPEATDTVAPVAWIAIAGGGAGR